jgi:hypothetical protein
MFLLDVKTFAGGNRPAIVARQMIGGFYHISIGVFRSKAVGCRIRRRRDRRRETLSISLGETCAGPLS